MLDAATLNAIGRQLRAVYDEQPEGELPEDLRRLLAEVNALPEA